MKFPRWLAPVLVLALLIPAVSASAQAAGGGQFFAETGHWVSGEFLAFYLTAKDPALVYGSPITEAYLDPLTGYTVQYFERARLEMQPGASPGNQVQVSPLGWMVYEPGPQDAGRGDTAACRLFEATRRSVCRAFLDFYEAQGGLEQFGQPISNLEYQDGLYVQYFDAARFEWHPERSSGQRVALTSLGRQYFDQRVNDPALLRPVIASGSPQPVLQLKARLFVGQAAAAPGSTQVVFVVVQDQYLRPVAGALPSVTATYPDGRQERFSLPETGPAGVSRLEFTVGSLPPDSIVSLAAEVSQGTLSASAGGWFRTWW